MRENRIWQTTFHTSPAQPDEQSLSFTPPVAWLATLETLLKLGVPAEPVIVHREESYLA